MTKILYSLKSVHTVLQKEKPSKVCVVTSEKLVKPLKWALTELNVPKSHVILLPDGEKVKEWKELEKLLKKLSDLNLDRRAVIIALGGGSIGDIVAFASSIYLRGINFIQVPTTLLAQVDSAHGGKTGINFLGYKNQIGSFALPLATIIDERFLETLLPEQIVDGLGEIIKAGFIKDSSILLLLRKYDLSNLVQSSDMVKIIKKSIAVKNHFVSNDFRDTSLRQILNFGHTLGHAIELKYKISHGRAVIIGMLQELKFTEFLKFTSPTVRKNLEALLTQFGIETSSDMKADWKTVLHDKKMSGDTIEFPVVVGEGKAKLVKLKSETLKKFLLK